MSHRKASAITLGLVTALAASLLSSAAFAEDAALSASFTPKMNAQVQFELLPLGSAKASAEGADSQTTDTDVAYGISASFTRDLHKNISVGLAPRLILNVASDEAGDNDDADKELDLRARITAHFPVAPKMEVYGSLTPGFTFVIPSADDVDSATGFAIGAAAGATYDVSPAMFLNAELGYQRAFTSASVMALGQEFDVDLDLSYMHVGVGAGTRF
jgi:hypothetical protein